MKILTALFPGGLLIASMLIIQAGLISGLTHYFANHTDVGLRVVATSGVVVAVGYLGLVQAAIIQVIAEG